MIISMFGLFKKKNVVLREERKLGDYRFLGVEIKSNGDLVFEGQDLGSDVEKAFGAKEYEWYWTINESDIPKFQKAIGGKGGILTLLEKNFSNEKAAEIYQFMQENEIPFDGYSRIGD